MINEIFQESKDNQKIISIRMYGDGDDFWCGFIVDFTNKLVQIQHFSKYGELDGLVIEEIENIESVDKDNSYCKRLETLVKRNVETNTTILPSSDNWRVELLAKYSELDQVVSIGFVDNLVIISKVISIDNLWIQVQPLTPLGDYDGNSFYRVENITTVQVSSQEIFRRLKT